MPSLSRLSWRDAARWYEEGWWTDQSVPLLLATAASEAPPTSGVWDVDGFHSWSEIASRAVSIAGRLADLGVQAGDIVPIALPDSALAIASAVAVQTLGAASCPVSHHAGPADWDHVCRLVSARIVLVHSGIDLGESVHVRRCDPRGIEAPEGLSLDLLSCPNSADHVSDVMLTSGTTGRPKGVMNSANTKLCGLRGFVSSFDFGSEDVWACAAPMTHNAGWLYTVLPAMMTWASVVMVPRGNPKVMLETLIEANATIAFLVPTHIEDLNRQVGEASTAQRLSLRYVLTGAAPASEETLRAVALTWETTIISLYGLTECQAILFTRASDDVNTITTTVGRPCPGSLVELRDPTDPVRVVEPGQVGELVTRGPTTFLGYLGDEEATSAAFTADGWLRTGDLGQSIEGSLRVVGRLKEVILRGGATLSPVEIAAAIEQVLDGAAVCVVGLPDDRLGEMVCAVVEAPQRIDLEWLRGRLLESGFSRRMVPDRVDSMTELPRTDLGKIRTGEVRRVLLSRAPQE